MQSDADTKEHPAAELIPPVRPSAPWRVEQVEPLPGLRLRVRFRDGVEGVVEMNQFIHSDAAGVFSSLRNEAVFRQARVVMGVVTWPGDLDLAPDAMHTEICKRGVWVISP